MIGRSGVDFIHPDHLENSRAKKCARCGAAERPRIADTRYIHKDGREVTAVLDRRMVRAGQAATSSSAAT